MKIDTAIANFNKKIQKASNEEFRARCLMLMNQAIALTPVRTGRLRANWQGSFSGMPQGEIAGTSRASEPALRQQEGQDSTFYLANNLPYARPVEFGGPTNRPRRMLTRAIQAVASK